MFEIGRLTRLALGYESEGNSRPIEICVADWLADWPGATIGLLLMRPGEETYYPAVIKVLDGVLHFTPSRADMAIPGDGLAQIVLTDENDVELRSRVVRTMIECSLPGSGAEAPEEPMRPFVTQVLEAAAAAEKAAESAAAAADGVAEDAERAMTAADSAEEAAKRAEEALEQMGPGGGGSGTVTSVNGVQPDKAGNVVLEIPEPPTKLSQLEEDATHRLVSDEDISEWDSKSEFSGAYADLTGKPTIPTKLAQMAADSTHRLVTDTEKDAWNAKSTFSGKYADLTGKPTIPNVPSWALQSTKPTYTAAEVGALPSTYTPPNQTAAQVGADPAGTAASKVSTHNADEDAHPAIRQLVTNLSGRLNALADSDDTTLDQLSEIVAYIKSNKSLIDSITTGKVSVSDIVNNLTSTATNKPLSAAQGKALKALIDAIVVPTKLSELAADETHRLVTDAEKAVWNAKSTFSGAYADLTGKPTKVSAFENDAGYLTNQSVGDVLAPDIPIVFFGEALPQTKTDTVMPFTYVSRARKFDAYIKTKAQGTSSLSYPKKNQTVKMYADAELETPLEIDFQGWGPQSKHVYKANWIDLSHARNVVTAQLWGDVVKSRANYLALPELLRTSPNQGAVDGFPVIAYAGGVYQGRYTLNIPKDARMANMDATLDTHCILCGENYGSGCFRAAALIDGSDWSDEIHDTVPDAIKTRWNQVISFVQDSSDADFVANIGDYFFLDSLIDYYIFGVATCGLDAFAKNQIYMTYDGQRWIASMYDMDSTWGLWWNGQYFVDATYARNEFQDFKDGDGNLLYIRLEDLFHDQIRARWQELKEGALSFSNVMARFERFIGIVPPHIVADDYAVTTGDGLFTTIPSTETNNIQQLRAFVPKRLAYTDDFVTYFDWYAVTNNLQNCTTSNSTEHVEPGSAYSATITPASGYMVDTVVITMDGVDVTADVYSDGVISISAVTGDVVIAVTCTVAAAYTNLVPSSVDISGNPFNGGLGYYNGQELSGSSGSQRTSSASKSATCTGFIAAKAGDVIRVTGCGFASTALTNYYVAYAADKSHWGTISTSNVPYYNSTNNPESRPLDDGSGVTIADGVATMTIPNDDYHSSVAYIRISAQGDNVITPDGADLIVTINEEIV